MRKQRKATKIFSAGFTLIELLIVIAIIGIITTIVLQSMATSRDKANDSKIQQQLVSFRSSAEIYFNANNENYGTANNCNGGPNNIFKELDPVKGQPGVYIDPANMPNGVQIRCQSIPSAYAVKISSVARNGYWCVDSKATLKYVEDPVIVANTVCPP
jgi:prepilin-type N-terminal cleavage/methylation domain-containing protein